MGLFDKKNVKNTTTNDYTTNNSTTFVDNTVDYSDRSYTYEDSSDRSFTDNADNSLNLHQEDNSDNSLSFDDSSSHENSGNTSLSDYSDNSLTVAMTDNTGSSNSGNSSFSNSESFSSTSTTNNNTNVTDGGAFNVVNTLVSKVLDSQQSMINLVGLSSKSALQSANDLASRGIDGAMNIKAGEQISMNNNKAKTELAQTALKIAAIGGAVYVGARFLKR